MPQTIDERYFIMGEVLAEIISQNYTYTLNRADKNFAQLPPPQGTEINCEAAAWLAKRLAEERGVTAPKLDQNGKPVPNQTEQLKIEGSDLKLAKFSNKDGGFLVLANNGEKALGTTPPTIASNGISGWEFETHYRLFDVVGKKVYDPIFGTSGLQNPIGILASSTNKAGDVTTYGEKYKVTQVTTRVGNGFQMVRTVDVLSQEPVAQKYIIDDSKFTVLQ